MKDIRRLFTFQTAETNDLNNQIESYTTDEFIEKLTYSMFSNIFNNINRNDVDSLESVIYENVGTSSYHFIQSKLDINHVVGRGLIYVPDETYKSLHINDYIINDCSENFINNIFDKNQECDVFVIVGIESQGSKRAYIVKAVN